MPVRRFLTLDQAIAAVTEGKYEGEAEIAILPPVDTLDVFDVEDIDENALEEVDPADVCSELDMIMMESVTESDDDVPLAHFDKPPKLPHIAKQRSLLVNN
uniref:Uncharacterized protein n=1 Tax=Romanomermis culicivorax TaxID=13658 RepID=A0A915IML8_ROMCU